MLLGGVFSKMKKSFKNSRLHRLHSFARKSMQTKIVLKQSFARGCFLTPSETRAHSRLHVCTYYVGSLPVQTGIARLAATVGHFT